MELNDTLNNTLNIDNSILGEETYYYILIIIFSACCINNIKKLEIMKFFKNKYNNCIVEDELKEKLYTTTDGEICCICLEPFINTKYCSLDCGHIFHKPCLIQWLQLNQSCPSCRGII